MRTLSGVTTYFADQAENAEKGLNLCQHIVNAFNIVTGVVVEKSSQEQGCGERDDSHAKVRFVDPH